MLAKIKYLETTYVYLMMIFTKVSRTVLNTETKHLETIYTLIISTPYSHKVWDVYKLVEAMLNLVN